MTTRGGIPTNLCGTVNAATAARTRYREQAVNWIALGVLLGAWQLEAQLDRDNEPPSEPQLAFPKPSYACGSQPLWSAEPRGRSWIRRAKKGPSGSVLY